METTKSTAPSSKAARHAARVSAPGSTAAPSSEPRQIASSFVDPAGNKIRLVASAKKSSWVVRALYTSSDGARKMKGMTRRSPDAAGIKVEISKITAELTAAGWVQKTRAVGASAADDFTAAPAAAVKPAKK